MAPPLGELSASLTERALSALRAPLPEGEARLDILPRLWLVRQTSIYRVADRTDKHVHFSYAEADREIPVCLRFLLI